MQLAGKNIIITGASSGIGEAAAKLFAAEGANVVLGARRGQLLETHASEIIRAFYAAKYQVPALLDAGGGSIVFTSSFVGHTVGLPGMGAYAAAKAGLIGLAQVLAAEHGPQGLRANTLLPGGTLTPMAGDDPSYHDIVRGLHALKRMASPKEIAQAALFLVSDASSFVTGTALIADGGNSISKF